MFSSDRHHSVGGRWGLTQPGGLRAGSPTAGCADGLATGNGMGLGWGKRRAAQLRRMSAGQPVAWAVRLGLALALASPTAGQQVHTATNLPQLVSYMRIVQPDSNTVRLELAMKKFVPVDGVGPEVWLVGVTHIGESNYFTALQRHLDAQALVLFEGVRARPDAPTTGPEAAPEVDEGSLQLTLAESLGLSFQLKALNYRRAHFRNSDLSWPELQQLMIQGLSPTEARQSAAQLAVVMELLDSRSLLGAAVNLLVRLLGTSPKLQALTRLAIIEVAGRLEGDMAEAPGLPEEFQRLMQVLIRARNGVVLKDLQAELRKKSPPASLAVLFGAGHMPDLETRLQTELNYRPAETRWLPAITVRLAEAGVTEAEAQFVRRLVKWQMDALVRKPARAAPSPTPAMQKPPS